MRQILLHLLVGSLNCIYIYLCIYPSIYNSTRYVIYTYTYIHTSEQKKKAQNDGYRKQTTAFKQLLEILLLPITIKTITGFIFMARSRFSKSSNARKNMLPDCGEEMVL